jgi:hypothetical protein
VQLQSKALASVQPQYPDRVEHVPVAQRAHRLHFLHGAGGDSPEGTTIARYIINYADGQKREVLMRYGQEVLNWHQSKDQAATSKAAGTIAWEGSQARWAKQPNKCIRLYKMTWENPWPDIQIESFDFVSAMETAAPFLLAITAE